MLIQYLRPMSSIEKVTYNSIRSAIRKMNKSLGKISIMKYCRYNKFFISYKNPHSEGIEKKIHCFIAK